MRTMTKSFLGVALGLIVLVALAPSAWAQTSTGNIYGNIADESGAVLPGATVTLTGAAIGGRSTTGGSQGDFRFLNLDPGMYKLSVALTGFTTVNREVKVVTGTNVNLTFGLKVATVEETVTVTAETPMVDSKKTGTATTMMRDELEKTPQARDPWAVLRTIPGVLVDRVNIAGNESGQQANFTGKGASDDDTQWNLDGVVITDMAAIGAAPTYFDFDAFDEISVSTGGNDIRAATGGLNLNFVTKRGTNAFHGGGRYFLTHDDLQSSNLNDELLSHKLPSGAADNRLKNNNFCSITFVAGLAVSGTCSITGESCSSSSQCPTTGFDPFRDKADHIQQITDYGFDVGGPIMKDKLWFYGSYGVQDIRVRRLAGTRDKTKLESYNGKLNWQATSNDMLSVFYFKGNKIKFGRGVGVGLNELPEFLWNQGGEKPEGGLGFDGLGKAEWNHIFGPNFVVNAKYAYYGTGFGLRCAGGIELPGVLDYVNGTAEGCSLDYVTTRPQHTANVDANYFLTGMGGNHELKFGFGYRKTPVTSSSVYGGRLWGYDYGGGGYAVVYRDALIKYAGEYKSAYLGDTFTKDRLTLNVGVRFDAQHANNVASTIPASASFPNLLPSVNYDGSGTEIDWKDISPRIGITYALDEARRTVLRASYARYAGQLSIGDVAFYQNPVAASGLIYYWVDANGDGKITPGEVVGGDGGAPSLDNVLLSFNVDPADPSKATSVRAIDTDYSSNKDNEFVLGVDRELAPNFALSAAYTFRRSNNLGWAPAICGTTAAPRACTRADYVAQAASTRTNPEGTFTFQPNRVSPTALRAPRGNILTNRDDYYRQYHGMELSATKRLSNKWMGRAAFSWNNWTEHFKSDAAIADPTTLRTSPLLDGGQVTILAGGSGKAQIYSSVKWQISANAMVQLPWDVELAGALFGRQGHPIPLFATIRVSPEPSKAILPNDGNNVDAVRLPNLWNVDLRLAKNVKIGSATVVLSAEAFNVFNSGTELTRFRDAISASFNRLDEILSPRIVRFGLRFLF